MISVLKLPTEQGILPIKICPVCGCVMTYDKTDEAFGYVQNTLGIFCPHCGSFLVTQSNQKTFSIKELREAND